MKHLLVFAFILTAVLLVVSCERTVNKQMPADDPSTTAGCLECHSGYLDQAQGEWANSIHASGSNVDYTNRGGTACAQCHDQQGFVGFWDNGTLPDGPLNTVSAIGCFTCHNPHENGDMRIRYADPYTLENGVVFDHGNGNICVMCHHSRYDVADKVFSGVEPNSRYGPHNGPQGDLIQGTNAWEFPGEGYTWTSSPHATQVEDACAGCHMGNPAKVHEGYKVGGHSFQMVDEESGYDLGLVCGSGGTCHVGETSFNFVGADSTDWDWDGEVEGYQDEIDGLMDSLEVLLVDKGIWTAIGGKPVGDPIADANMAGAIYNYKFLLKDRSHGIHNFKYAKDLMRNSIDYLEGL